MSKKSGNPKTALLLILNIFLFSLTGYTESLTANLMNEILFCKEFYTWSCENTCYIVAVIALMQNDQVPGVSLQTYHVYSTLKQRGNGRFYVVSTCNTRGMFVGFTVKLQYFRYCHHFYISFLYHPGAPAMKKRIEFLFKQAFYEFPEEIRLFFSMINNVYPNNVYCRGVFRTLSNN